MKDLQKQVEKFVEKHNLKHRPEISALDLVSEVGEVAKEILKSTDYGKKPATTASPELKEELGDVLYSLITLANAYDIDLEDALKMVMEKYENRFSKE